MSRRPMGLHGLLEGGFYLFTDFHVEDGDNMYILSLSTIITVKTSNLVLSIQIYSVFREWTGAISRQGL
jgi:hypothetical protein